MYEHFEHYFGFVLDPAPDDLDINRQIEIQLMAGTKDKPGEWTRFGARFSAGRIDDLVHALQRAKKVLETESKKIGTDYYPRRRIF